jgi:hypothetical protein
MEDITAMALIQQVEAATAEDAEVASHSDALKPKPQGNNTADANAADAAPDADAADDDDDDDDEGPPGFSGIPAAASDPALVPAHLVPPCVVRHDKDIAEIFVGGLPAAATEAEVLAVFGQAGEVAAVRLKRDAAGLCAGFAFVVGGGKYCSPHHTLPINSSK